LINLYIKERQIGDVTVLDLKGRLRVGGATVALHRSFRSLVQEEKIMILLNLTGVTHIDSSGLGELISSHVTVFNKGGEIKLVQLTETLSELMSVTKLLTVFDVYETEADALFSFQNHPLRVKESKLSLSRVG
jgi:anti-sigma B factor antagonist